MVVLVSFVVIGVVVATIAKALVPGRDPGLGITILLGTTAQVAAWYVGRSMGLARYGQPWSFFLSIAAAVVLLYAYRESGFEEVLASRVVRVPHEARPDAGGAELRQTRSLDARIALGVAWAAIGGLMLGATGFVIGFFGPIRFQPWANQGPLLGIFVTGPGGLLLGALIGGALAVARPEWPTRWRLGTLNVATAAYGLFVLHLVADRSWWH